MNSCTLLTVLIILVCFQSYSVLAALPDLVVQFTPNELSESGSSTTQNDTSIEFFAKRAQFGSRDRSLQGLLVQAPDYDPFLCERFSRTNGFATLPPYQKPDKKNSTVMLVPRGECTFERKAYAAKHFYGAKAIMIYDRLGARYTWNETTNRVNFPNAGLDYECANGNAIMYDLALDPPAYNSTQLDPLMGLATDNIDMASVCDLTNTAFQPCESNLCLVTSHLENSTEYPVCCAWDTPATMPVADDAKDFNTDDILALWVTIRDHELLEKSGLLSSGSTVSIKTRGSNSNFNVTYIFMWCWGVLVTIFGAWYAAGYYRKFDSDLTAYKESKGNDETGNDVIEQNSNSDKGKGGKSYTGGLQTDLESGEPSFKDEMEDKTADTDSKPKFRFGGQQNKQKKKRNEHKPKQKEEGWSLRSLPPPERKRKQKKSTRSKIAEQGNDTQSKNEGEPGNTTPTIPARESDTISPFEMTQWHVFGFVVMMSLTLVLLFFVPKAFNILFVIYGIGCAGAVCYLVFNPLVAAVIPKFGDSWVEEFNRPVLCGFNGFSVTSQLIGYIWIAVWLWYGITHYRPETNVFFWISLDFLGACFCILMLSWLKLNSIKIATILMVAIFIYDVFFVFITPLFTGGTSVMLKVASGSSSPSGEDFCYKYPDDKFCKGISFLPMLFIFPRVNDYANGSVLLGLGDVILPGFLIAFSARYDEATRLVSKHTTNPDVQIEMKWYQGFFLPMSIAYSLGLFLAFLAVILTGQGQPALLYICPICLATIFFIGRNDVKDLWNGTNVFKQADKLKAKTEREWGKARMKRFAERRKRENAALENDSGNEHNPDQLSTGRSVGKQPKEPTSREIGTTPSNYIQPRPKDICFGNEVHSGTQVFHKVVKEVAADLGKEEYKPEIYKIIRKKLKGCRFFTRDNTVWVEASNLEIRKQIGHAYDRARGGRSTVLED